MFFGLAGSVIAHFSPLGHSMRPTNKLDVSVGDRNIILFDARPRFALGDGVWGFLPFYSRVLGGLESTTKNPDPILSVNPDMDVSFSWMDSRSMGIEGIPGLVLYRK